MNIIQFEKLHLALARDEIDLLELQNLTTELEEQGNTDALLQSLSKAFSDGKSQEEILKEAHKIRSVANFIPVKYIWQSKEYLSGHSNEEVKNV